MINTDGFGNYFLGSARSPMTRSAFIGGSGASSPGVRDLLISATGSNTLVAEIATSTTSGIGWRPNINDEPIPLSTQATGSTSSGLVTGSSGRNTCRFHMRFSFTGTTDDTSLLSINTAATVGSESWIGNTNVISSGTAPHTIIFSDNATIFRATATSATLAVSQYKDPSNYAFHWLGVLADTGLGYTSSLAGLYVQRVAGVLSYGTVGSTTTFHTTAAIASYGIVCSNNLSHGSDLWCTDFYLVTEGNQALGKCANLLKASGTTFQVGQIYRIGNTTAVDNSNKLLYMCVADWGVNEKILMRVWN